MKAKIDQRTGRVSRAGSQRDLRQILSTTVYDNAWIDAGNVDEM
jgi:hypothetical protein